MTGLFRNQHPFTVVLLFFLGIAMRPAAFLMPVLPQRSPGDGYLYTLFADQLVSAFQSSTWMLALIAYCFVFLQALLLNAQMEKDKLLPRTGFLPALSYLLLTALLPDWRGLSALMVSTTLVIKIWGDVIRVFNAGRPGNIVFNAGILMGLSALIFFPSIIFAAFIFFAPAVLGTPRFRDWISAFVGLLMPFYFFLSWLYLTSGMHHAHLTFAIPFRLPRLEFIPLTWVSLALLLLPILWGVGLLNRQLPRMLIRNRKIWTLFYSYLFLGIVIGFWGAGQGFGSFYLAFVPVAAFHSIVYENSGRQWLSRLLLWTTIFAILSWNFLLLNK